MNPQTADKIVREACIRANPRLMDTGFGVSFVYTYKHYLNGTSFTLIAKEGIMLAKPKSTGHFLGIVKGNKNARTYLPGFDDIEILGHEPQLADVLLALDKKDIKGSMDFHGNIGVLPFKGHTDWNLSLSYSQQSDEVKLFLGEILK